MQYILVADDHAVTRRGIREFLLETYTQANIIEAEDAVSALALIPVHPWNLILLDVMMPGPPVLELLAALRAINPTVPVLMLTAAQETQYVVETMKAGANGLIHKYLAADDLLDAIQRVASGGTYLHADTAVAIAKTLREQKPTKPHELLSERELDIFRRIALGRAVKEIAFDLDLSDKTVATYLARIREKTGLNGLVEIARYALRNGLVD